MQPLLINGIWSAAHSQAVLPVHNPATLEVAGQVSDADEHDVARAVAAARAAAAHWISLPATMRVSLLASLGARVAGAADEIARLLTCESGKPRCEALDCVAAVAHGLSCADADAVFARDVPLSPGAVVAALGPTDHPLLGVMRAIVPALAGGHTVVCLPAPQTPLSLLALAALADGLPSGVLNVLTGGAHARQVLAGHPDVGCVVTAGNASAVAVAGAAPALRAGPLAPDPGPFVVCRDAELELAVPLIAWSCLHNAGQSHALRGLVYADSGIAAELTATLHGYVGLLEVDDPARSGTDIGPMCTLADARRVEDRVMAALRERAMPVLGGRRFRPCGLPGHYFQPTILSGLRDDAGALREPIGGPVILIATVAGTAEALRRVRRPGAAVAASVLTRDVDAAIALAGELGSGTLYVNDPRSGVYQLDAGGAPPGGVGCVVRAQLSAKPWWFPYANRASAHPGPG